MRRSSHPAKAFGGPFTRSDRALLPAAALWLAIAVVACGERPLGPTAGLDCDVALDLVAERMFGGDQVPALTNPDLSVFGRPEMFYLRSEDRVIGLLVEGQPLAVPHNILWWHEIVNFEFPSGRVAVSYSPLTGSSLAFDMDAAAVGKFVVSDFMFNSNTMLEDVETGSLWAQMDRRAQCGDRKGSALRIIPTWDMTWGVWRMIFPSTLAVASTTGFDFFYTIYPYDDYERPDNPEMLFPVERIDSRLAPKQRVLGIPIGAGGLAFPYSELEAMAGSPAAAVVNLSLDSGPAVVFWSTVAQSAVAYEAEVDGQALTFQVNDDGEIRDVQTGSAWNLAGQVLVGPLAGRQLELLPDAYTAFWFAWAIFQPDTGIWAP